MKLKVWAPIDLRDGGVQIVLENKTNSQIARFKSDGALYRVVDKFDRSSVADEVEFLVSMLTLSGYNTSDSYIDVGIADVGVARMFVDTNKADPVLDEQEARNAINSAVDGICRGLEHIYKFREADTVRQDFDKLVNGLITPEEEHANG